MTAVQTTNERWCEAEVHRMAGEILLTSPERDAVKADAYFRRAQQADLLDRVISRCPFLSMVEGRGDQKSH